MNKNLIWLLVAAFLVAAPATDAQPQSKIPKIGWLGGRSPGGPPGSGGEVSAERFALSVTSKVRP